MSVCAYNKIGFTPATPGSVIAVATNSYAGLRGAAPNGYWIAVAAEVDKHGCVQSYRLLDEPASKKPARTTRNDVIEVATGVSPGAIPVGFPGWFESLPAVRKALLPFREVPS